MYICMTESQKKCINESGNMMVVEFKRILIKIKLAFEELFEAVRNCIICLGKLRENF